MDPLVSFSSYLSFSAAMSWKWEPATIISISRDAHKEFNLTSKEHEGFPGEAIGKFKSISAETESVLWWEDASRPLASLVSARCWLSNNKFRYPSKISSSLQGSSACVEMLFHEEICWISHKWKQNKRKEKKKNALHVLLPVIYALYLLLPVVYWMCSFGCLFWSVFPWDAWLCLWWISYVVVLFLTYDTCVQALLC